MSGLSVKDKRYDRQLRLWGDHGQLALEAAHVCLINATGTGAEILKNLVLPGIGAFTLVDSNQVTVSDLNSNFFVTPDKLGTSRATCVAELLCELNTDVRSSVCTERLDTVLDNLPQFFNEFTVVIATDVSEDRLKRLADTLWSQEVPLLVARSYGMVGYLRLVVQSHEIVESHPDNAHQDLRLDTPFPSLVSHMEQFNLHVMDNPKHANVPYLVILYKYLEVWRDGHDGKFPSNYREKKEFKELVRSGIRTNEDGVPLDEENFGEAINNVNSLVVNTSLPSQVKNIMEDGSAKSLANGSGGNFWVLVRALQEFVSNEGKGMLPLRGSIPDMMSSSDLYIDLQRVYQTKARDDAQVVMEYVNQLLASVGRSEHSVSEREVQLFCRNSAFLRVVRTRSISQELEQPNLAQLAMELTDPYSNCVYYVLLRGAEVFYSRFKVYPGNTDLPVESDIAQLRSIVVALLQDWGMSSDCTITDEHLHEFCRFGAAELHSVASYVGGVASQEVIKVITRQYVPINNTYIYNAASSTSSTVEM